MSAKPFAIRHKFKAVATAVDGIRFDSKREAAYYLKLKLQVAAGEVVTFLRQVPFHLPGGVRYVCDFQVFLASGEVLFVDTKGVQTESFKAKKRMVEQLYQPIKITLA
jgi:hypothetical protein